MTLRTLGLILFTAALCAVAPAAFAQEAGTPATSEDIALFTTALSNTPAEAGFAFDVFLDASLSVDSSSSAHLIVEGEGSIDQSGDRPALSLDLRGQLVADGDDYPIDLALRLQDGVLYYTVAGSEADPALWTGVVLDDVQSLLNAQMTLAADSDAPSNLDELGNRVGNLVSLFENSGIRPTDFLTLTRLEDTEADGVPAAQFVLDISPAGFVTADGFVSLVRSLVQAFPEADGEALGNNARLIGVVLSSFFEQTTIRYEVRIDPAAELMRSGELIIDAVLDPSLLGDSTGPVTVNLDLAVDLHDFGQPPAVVVPEGIAVMTGPDLAASSGLNAPSAPVPGPTLPTATATTVNATIPPIIKNSPTPAATTVPTASPTPVPTATATSASVVTDLALAVNVPQEVTLSGDSPVELTFNGERGQIISVSARSLDAASGLDTTLELLDLSGVRLGFNDDLTSPRPGFSSLDSVIDRVKLPAAGVYRVVVSAFAPGATGPVEVLVSTGDSTNTAPATPTGDYPITTVSTSAVPANGEDCTTVNALAGELITASARALDPALDPALTLRAPDGSDLAFNDDHSPADPALSRFDSKIEDASIPADGAYTLCVSGFAGSAGQYELSVTRDLGGTTALPTATATLIGTADQPETQVITDEVTAGDQYQTTIEGQAGDVYTITVRALDGNLDPQLGVFASTSSEILAGNDDHSSSDAELAFFDLRITNLILPADGAYDIVIAGYEDSSGPFELTITRTARNAPLGTPAVETVSGKLEPNGVYAYEVTLPEGAYVTITVSGRDDQLDPQVTLITPAGVVAADNDDHSSEDQSLNPSDSRIRNFFVAEPGVYTIEVRGYQGSSGPFTLTIATLQ